MSAPLRVPTLTALLLVALAGVRRRMQSACSPARQRATAERHHVRPGPRTDARQAPHRDDAGRLGRVRLRRRRAGRSLLRQRQRHPAGPSRRLVPQPALSQPRRFQVRGHDCSGRRRRAGASRWARPLPTSTTTVTPTCSCLASGSRLLYRNTRQRHVRGRHAAAGIRPRAWSVAAGWTRRRSRRAARSVRRQLLDWNGKARPVLRRSDARHPRLLPPEVLRRACPTAVSQPRQRHIRRHLEKSRASRAHIGKGMSVGVRRLRRRRLHDLFVTNDGCRTSCSETSRQGASRRQRCWQAWRARLRTAGVEHGRRGAGLHNDGRPDLLVTALEG